MSIQPIPPDPNTIERIEALRARHAVTALTPLGDDADHNRARLGELVHAVAETVSSFTDRDQCRWLRERLEREAADIRPVPRPGAWFVATDGADHETLVLPETFAPIVFHDRHYYVRPLIQAAATHGEFLLLALSLSGVTLYRLSGERMQRLTSPTLPGAPLSAAGSSANGHDPGTAAVEGFLQAVSTALCDDISLHEQYVMIAAEAELAEHFRAISTHPHLLPPTVPLSPDRIAEDRLRRAAQDAYEQWRRAETLRFVEGLWEHPQTATRDPEEVIEAARGGRIDTLIAARQGHLWGRLDTDGQGIELHAARQPDSSELVDAAMRAAWRHGGRIRIADPDDLAVPLMARLRD